MLSAGITRAGRRRRSIVMVARGRRRPALRCIYRVEAVIFKFQALRDSGRDSSAFAHSHVSYVGDTYVSLLTLYLHDVQFLSRAEAK